MHTPLLKGAAVVRTRAPEYEKKMFENFNAALTGQVQALVILTTKHYWARMDPQVYQVQLSYKYPRFSSKKRLRQGLHCTQEVRKSCASLPALESTGFVHLHLQCCCGRHLAFFQECPGRYPRITTCKCALCGCPVRNALVDLFPPATVSSQIAQVDRLKILERMVSGSSPLLSGLFLTFFFSN